MNFLNESVLIALAAKLFSSQRRLANRMETGEPPLLAEMVLRFYLQHREYSRAPTASPASAGVEDEAFNSSKEKMRLLHLVDLEHLRTVHEKSCVWPVLPGYCALELEFCIV